MSPRQPQPSQENWREQNSIRATQSTKDRAWKTVRDNIDNMYVVRSTNEVPGSQFISDSSAGLNSQVLSLTHIRHTYGVCCPPPRCWRAVLPIRAVLFYACSYRARAFFFTSSFYVEVLEIINNNTTLEYSFIVLL
jgi:hypothetical protein